MLPHHNALILLLHALHADAQVYVPWEAVAGNLQEDIGMQDGLEFAEVDFGSVEDFYEPDRPSRRRLFG
eukprot:1161248-Pelagomonas_calceolata.AAC.1